MNSRNGYKFIAMQVILLGAIFFSPYFNSAGANLFSKTVGGLLFGLGMIILLTSVKFLGRSLTPNPVPKETATLVTNGTYKWVRHPMYTSVILISFGWSLIFLSVLGGIISCVLIAFLVKKAAFEEELLVEKFGKQYLDYKKITGRFFPS